MTDPSEMAAIVLAAGRSSRMGRNKLLIPLADGRTLIEHAVAAVRPAVELVLVVVGHDSAGIRHVLRGHDVVTVDNPDYAHGMATSLKAGVAALPEDVSAFFVCLGDMPGINTALLRRMRSALIASGKAGIVVPIRYGRRGHPVLWRRRFGAVMAELAGDLGAKTMLDCYAADIIEVEAPDDGIFEDLDTPEALCRFAYGAG